MNIQRLTPVLFGFMLSGGLIATSAAAQMAASSKQNLPVQHLTCVQDTQGLMCTHNEASNVSSGVEQTTVSKAELSAPEGLTAEQLGQVSNLLLGVMYFGLPIALVFAVLRHDKRYAERIQQIEQLKRIWGQSPQH
jgi:predicted PurR-regulated permease PerM